MTKLSKPRKDLLQYVSLAGGSVSGKRLSLPSRTLASRMQSDGLVRWRAPPELGTRRGNNLDNWTLFLTDKGAEILRAAT